MGSICGGRGDAFEVEEHRRAEFGASISGNAMFGYYSQVKPSLKSPKLKKLIGLILALWVVACGTEVDDRRFQSGNGQGPGAEEQLDRRPGRYFSARSGMIVKGGVSTEDLMDYKCAGIDEIAAYLEFESPKDSPFAQLRENQTGGRRDFVSGIERAVNRHQLNPLFIVALAIHESGWGRSAIAKDKRNLFGYQAFDSSPYSSAHAFPSLAEGTDFVIGKIKADYLLPGGKFFEGANLEGINKTYASDRQWASKVRAHMGYVADFINRSRNGSSI